MRRHHGEPSSLQRRLAVAVAVVVGFPALVKATTGGVNLTWTAPAECPTSADVSASVGDLLGRPLAVPEGRELEVRARAERRRAGRWIGSVETRYGSTLGSRSFETESCQAAADATALIVALMIDPTAVAARTPTLDTPPENGAPRHDTITGARVPPANVTTATPESASVTVTDGPTRRGESPSLARAPGPSLRVFVGPTTAMDVGTLPGPTAGAGARLGVRVGRTSFDLAGVAWASTSTTIPGTNPPAGGTFRFFSASLAVCPTLEAGRFELGACGEAELVQVQGRGSGVSVPYESTFAWTSVGAGALARLRVSRHLSIPFRLHALVPLARPSFVLKGVAEDQGEVYRAASLLGRAELGIDVDF